MAVVAVDKHYLREGGLDEAATFVEEYLVQTDDPADGPDVVLYASGIPVRGASFVLSDNVTADPTVRVQSKSCRLKEDTGSRTLWTVVVNYSSNAPDEDGDDLTEPEEAPAEVRITFAESSVAAAYQVDADGNIDDTSSGGAGGTVDPGTGSVWTMDGSKITNSAGAQFDPPVERSIWDLVITITRNEPTLDLDQLQELNGSLNADTFAGFESGQVLLVIDASRGFDQGEVFYTKTYTLAVRTDGWQPKVVDEGYYEINQNSGAGCDAQITATDENGNPLSAPRLLNGRGRFQSCDPAEQAPILLEFRTFKVKSWGVLDLESELP